MNANDLPLPLLYASIVLCTLAMVLWSLRTHGRLASDLPGTVAVTASCACLVLAFLVMVTAP